MLRATPVRASASCAAYATTSPRRESRNCDECVARAVLARASLRRLGPAPRPLAGRRCALRRLARGALGGLGRGGALGGLARGGALGRLAGGAPGARGTPARS